MHAFGCEGVLDFVLEVLDGGLQGVDVVVEIEDDKWGCGHCECLCRGRRQKSALLLVKGTE